MPRDHTLVPAGTQHQTGTEAFESHPEANSADPYAAARCRVRTRSYLLVPARYPAPASFIEQTVETELAEELSFLASYDRTKRAMQEVVDLPDRDLDLFIRLCLQNQGKLSKAKRDSTFRALKDDEVAQLERCVSDGYGSAGSGESYPR